MKFIMSKNRHPCHVGLALGSGGARGWAHLGVLKALSERRIRVDAIAGASIGALVGGFAAAGQVPVLEQLLREMDLKRVIYLFAGKTLPRSGLVDGRKIVELIRHHVGSTEIRDLVIPFCAVATDLGTGDEVVMNKGDVVTAIRASISIPGVFTPVKHDGRYLVDGGLVNPLPVSCLRRMGCERIIAVNLHGGPPPPLDRPVITIPFHPPDPKGLSTGSTAAKTFEWLERQKDKVESVAHETLHRWLTKSREPSVFAVMGNTVDIVSAGLIKHSLMQDPPEILIEPEVQSIGHMEFHRVEEGMAAGYDAACRALDAAKWP